jgi:hypothetical protein
MIPRRRLTSPPFDLSHPNCDNRSLSSNFAVRDVAIHPRDHDLVIATHGRGIWIVDDSRGGKGALLGPLF